MIQTFQGTIANGRVTIQEAASLPEGVYRFVAMPETQSRAVIDERVAQRRAKMWIIDHVSLTATAMHGELIELGDHIAWRFGVYLATRQQYGTGPFGFVHVDAQTGELLINQNETNQLITNGRLFARSVSSSTQ